MDSAPYSTIEQAFDWRAAIRLWRERRGLTQSELAERAGLSLVSVKAYESGKRHPSEASLTSIISALGLPREEANLVLGGAGYAIDWSSVLEERYAPLTVEDLRTEAARYPWPAFVTNQSFDVVATNRAFEAVFEVDLKREYQGFGERNFLGGITHDEFAGRLANWDDVVTFMCGLAKADRRWRSEGLSRPAPWLEAPIQRFLEGNPARIKRFMELWEAAPPVQHHIRQRFTIHWLYRHETLMRFEGRLVVADLWNELHWNEWIPADAETWRLLEEITGRR